MIAQAHYNPSIYHDETHNIMGIDSCVMESVGYRSALVDRMDIIRTPRLSKKPVNTGCMRNGKGVSLIEFMPLPVTAHTPSARRDAVPRAHRPAGLHPQIRGGAGPTGHPAPGPPRSGGSMQADSPSSPPYGTPFALNAEKAPNRLQAKRGTLYA